MRVYEGRALGDFYFNLLRDIDREGRIIETRGKKCKELPEPVTLVYKEPSMHWMPILGRKFNPFFALAEVVWILNGDGSISWIEYFNKNMRSFNDGDYSNHGAYGLRMRNWPISVGNIAWGQIRNPLKNSGVDQVAAVIAKLRNDPCSRRAIINLWDPIADNLSFSKDYPCNQNVQLSLRDGKLDMMVVIRSNDLIWGTPVNIIQFSHLQALIAGSLKVTVGTLRYVVHNLHFYVDDTYPPELLKNLRHTANCNDNPGCVGMHRNLFTCDEDAFKTCRDKVYAMRAVGDLETDFETLENLGFYALGYWLDIIPKMIWLYMAGRTDFVKDDVRIKNCVESIPEFLLDQVVDFWKDSKLPAVKRILKLI